MAQEGDTNSVKEISKNEAIRDPQEDGEEWIGCRWGWGYMGRSSLLTMKLQSTEFPPLNYSCTCQSRQKLRSDEVHVCLCIHVYALGSGGIYEGHLGEVSSSRRRPQSLLVLFSPSSSSPPCLPPPTPPPLSPPSPSSLCYRHSPVGDIQSALCVWFPISISFVSSFRFRR